MDTHDNEFVIGLIGSRLHPLSHLVQRLRATKQTAVYIQSMGPFFIGYAVWQKAEA
jgi:chlorite dismutase